jgi:hypothetical protein
LKKVPGSFMGGSQAAEGGYRTEITPLSVIRPANQSS